MMKPNPENPGKRLSKDQKTFEKLPDDTQDSLLLGDHAEKTSGKKRAATDREITNRATAANK